jgi:hypothetical protein
MTGAGWGYDPDDELDPGASNGPANPNGSFRLTRLSAIKLDTSVQCIVEDLIPREGLILVWGPPKCAKSFVVFDLVGHIALGRAYGEREVEQGPIVYIAAEGERGIKARGIAFRQARMNGEDPPFFLMTTALDLVDQIDALILQVGKQLRQTENGCKAIVLDTLNRTIHGSETKDEDMCRRPIGSGKPSIAP